ncbi:MAG: TolC family outer membrane protein [Opitutales bacterium]|nr:TolC family outer membrane protein [Opitutales bacterium]
MKTHQFKGICAGLFLSAVSLHGENLMDVFHLAEQNNSDYEAVKYRFEAQQETLNIGRAALLPQVSASANWNWNSDELTFTDGGDQTQGMAGEHGYDTKSLSLTLRQPLFNWYALRRYQRAKTEVLQSALQFESAHQQLILQSASAYLNILLARESKDTAVAEKEALEEYFNRVSKSYDAGLADVTTLNEARARNDLATSSLIAAENDLVVAEYAMERLIGQQLTDLDSLSREINLQLPDPQDRQYWIDAAMQGNIAFKAAELGVDIARYQVGEAEGNRYPTVDLVANQYWSEDDTMHRPVDLDNQFFGLQVSVPLFTGGLLTSQARSAQSMLSAARADRETARRTAIYDTTSAFTNVLRYESSCRAARQAVVSTQSALEATTVAVENGLRTPLDQLDALTQHYTALRSESNARYAYLLARLQLRYAIGDLREADLMEIQNLQ